MLMRQSRFRRSRKQCRLNLSIPYVTCLVYDCLISSQLLTSCQPVMQQDPYRSLPPPAQMYPGYGPPMGYAAPAQPAPRQRTAIACRYCRRRKVRWI
jgi:hypothetical protein